MTADRSTAVLAHGLGGSTDLPIPFTYALIGAAWALTFTFAVVALAWRRAAVRPGKPGRPLPAVGDDGRRRPGHPVGGRDRGAAVRGLGGRRGGVRSAGRPTTRCSACSTCCCGSAWWRCRWPSGRCGARCRRCARCYRLLRVGRRAAAVRLSRRRLGYWPAVLGLFAFVWLELASPDPGSLAAMKIWLLLYLAVTLAGRWCSGPLVRPRRPVRGVRRGGVAAVAAAAQRATAASRSATRSTTCRRCRCGRAPSRCWRCCWGRRRSTASRRCRSGATSSTHMPARFRCGAVADPHRRPAGVRRRRSAPRSGWPRARPAASTAQRAANCPG